MKPFTNTYGLLIIHKKDRDVRYFIGQVPVEKEFKAIEELLDFVFEDKDYLALLLKDKSLTIGQDNGFDKQLGWKMMKKTFAIEIRNKRIFLEYAIGQIPIEKEFTTIETLLDFVKEVFPIEK